MPGLPNWEQLQALGLNVTKIELEPLSATCVRLVVWGGELRLVQLTADPRRPEKLRRLLEVAEVFLCAQAGGDREQLLNEIRRR